MIKFQNECETSRCSTSASVKLADARRSGSTADVFHQPSISTPRL